MTQALTIPVPSSGKWFIEAYAKEELVLVMLFYWYCQ